MIADFYDVFDDSAEKGLEIPQEVLDILSENLPSNYTYYKDEKYGYRVGPKSENLSEKMLLKVEIDQDFVEEYLSEIPVEKWAEYCYCMQLRVPVKNPRIGDSEKQIPIEETVGNPLESNIEISESFMEPEPFPEPVEMKFETVEGDAVTLHIKRQPYPSLEEARFSNIDFPAIKMNFYLADNHVDSRITCSVTPSNAETVQEALTALRLFQNFYHGTLKVDGNPISGLTFEVLKFDQEELSSALEMWTTAKKLEEILQVSFKPSAEFPMEDAEFFSQLDLCLLRNRAIGWEHPFDHFHMNGIQVESEKIEELFGKESLRFSFVEGPIPATLLGAEFEIFSQTEMKDIVMTNVVWDDEAKKSGEIYISDPVDGTWKLYRKYMTKEQVQLCK